MPATLIAVRRSIAGAVAVAVALLTAGTPAMAHTDLVDSSPKDGTTVDAAPSAVELVFSEAIAAQYTQVAVLSAAGEHVEAGPPETNRERVTQPVGDLSPGAYTISYRVVSADGHPVSGELAFSIAPPPDTTPSPAPTPVATHAAEAPASSTDEGGTLTGLIVGLLAAVGAVAVIMYAAMRTRRPTPGDGPPGA